MMEINKRTIRTLSMLGSCGAFGLGMVDVAIDDPSVVAVTADLRNYSGLERFAEAFSERFYNVGIAEQNMLNIAAGMASEGLNPFASTYATFAAMRIADQVRTSMGYMRLPVKLVGLTAGYSVGVLGPTHMSIEDVAVMRAIPNITIIEPADGLATYKATMAAAKLDLPVYLRLTGEMGFPAVYKEDFDFVVGKAQVLREGANVLIIAAGSVIANALRAADSLAEKGIGCTVLDMHTVKPLDIDCICRHMADKNLIVTVEEHSVVGGLGSAVLEALAMESHPPIKVLGCPDLYPHAAEYKYLIAEAGLDPAGIAASIESGIRGK
ncbi:transketolase family protein [Adlercreutzia sp. ZJ138]|uniref:transketolase family protein n=1 Tax=Adlercreutzia sp. ZJ138 TaxID=2709405 RepID=UPI0013EBDBB4|nr:transketolase C-terminal domain-containing protein [Adlercreutzia sp. ZJ138]